MGAALPGRSVERGGLIAGFLSRPCGWLAGCWVLQGKIGDRIQNGMGGSPASFASAPATARSPGPLR